MLLLVMLGCLSIIGYTQYLFYTEEWKGSMGASSSSFALIAAIVIQIIRLASGLSSALQYKRNKIFGAITIFCFSVAVSVWEWNEVQALSKMIGGEATLFLLKFLVVVSLALEFGLASTIENEPTSNNTEKEEPEEKVITFSTNGSSSKKAKASKN